jgi:DNA-binding NtrC family response regulator
MATILIIEDSPPLAHTWRSQMEPVGHRVLLAGDGRSAFAMLAHESVDCILLDLTLPDINGLDILKQVRAAENPPAVIIVSANASINTAVQAVRGGAFDYLVKPCSAERLLTTVQNALANTGLRREVETLRRVTSSTRFGDFIGRSAPMLAVYRIIEAAAPSNASVFINGESGTGKELAAEALHRLSPRKGRNFVALNCGTIPQDLLESTIFGHRKGAFTGATTDQEGAATRANGGTLFLDELGEMPMALQTKLLRFIQTGTYQPVGESRSLSTDIRFIAATNRDPAAAVREGLLREDLFYRLNVLPITMPPLRERGEDILLIAQHFLREFSKAEGRRFKTFAPEVDAILLAHRWPGNVRQLQNAIRNIVVLHDAEIVTPEMLPSLPATPPRRFDAAAETRDAGQAAPPPAGAAFDALLPLAEMERRYIEHVIAHCTGNTQAAARLLGISPSTIYRKQGGWKKA